MSKTPQSEELFTQEDLRKHEMQMELLETLNRDRELQKKFSTIECDSHSEQIRSFYINCCEYIILRQLLEMGIQHCIMHYADRPMAIVGNELVQKIKTQAGL